MNFFIISSSPLRSSRYTVSGTLSALFLPLPLPQGHHPPFASLPSSTSFTVASATTSFFSVSPKVLELETLLEAGPPEGVGGALVGIFPHSQLCSCWSCEAALSLTLSLLADSNSVSEQMGELGLDPIGEVLGDNSGSLKYWVFLITTFSGEASSCIDDFLLSILRIWSSFSLSGSLERKKESLTEFSRGGIPPPAAPAAAQFEDPSISGKREHDDDMRPRMGPAPVGVAPSSLSGIL